MRIKHFFLTIIFSVYSMNAMESKNISEKKSKNAITHEVLINQYSTVYEGNKAQLPSKENFLTIIREYRNLKLTNHVSK